MLRTPEKLNGVSGVYSAIHRDTGACYVGSSVNLGQRRNEHISEANRGSEVAFHRGIRRYGSEAFDFEVLERCEQSKLLEHERFYIALLDAASVNGFNSRPDPTAQYGRLTSDLTRQRIGAANKGRVPTAEHREKIRIANTGKKHTPESLAKMNMKLRVGVHVHTSESRQKIRESKRGWKPSPEHLRAFHEGLRKYVRTPEHRAKLSVALMGHPVSAEARLKMGVSQRLRKSKPHTTETKAKMSATAKGKKKSPEHVEKMRRNALTQWVLI